MLDWLDKNGWLHTDKFPELDQSENKIMFTAILGLSENVSIPFNEVRSGDSFRRNQIRDWNTHFSHDEMTGLYCLYKQQNKIKEMKSLPVIAKRPYMTLLHPRDVAFYFYAKHRLFL